MPLLDIIAEDQDFAAVNKPQGLVCHPTKGDAYSSLISRARLHFGTEAYLVNRLDRETSGIVLIAKSSAVAGELGKIFEAGGAQKEYVAVVHGSVADDRGVIDAPLGKDLHSTVAIKDCVRPDGARARTEFVVKGRYGCGEKRFSILAVMPGSGRKHQIRIHLAHIGHSIVGDKIYGGDEAVYLRFVFGTLTEADHSALILANHALHARSLTFGWRGGQCAFTAAIPEAMAAFMGELEGTGDRRAERNLAPAAPSC